MIGDVVMALSAFVGTLALVDFFLTDVQKRKLSDAVLSVWNWLDDMKKRTFVEWLKRPRAQLIFLSAVGVTFSVSTFPITSGLLDDKLGFIVLVACLSCSTPAALWIGPKIFASISRSHTQQERLIHAMNPIVVPFWLTMGAAVALVFLSTWVPVPASSSYFAVLAILVLLYALLVGSAVITVFMLYLMLPVLAAGMLAFYLGIIEFIVRRIAEYPKGPVLALSALCGGLAALFKTLG
jgi:hypothetical protein